MKNKDLPLVSIVTPSYNQAEFIKETIESVLKQDYSNIEYMVMDGGSTDTTLDILKSYGERLCWVSEKDNGQADAINKGWKRGKGSVLAYLNSDDTYYKENAVSLAINFIQKNKSAGIVYGNSVYTNRDGKETGNYNAYPFDYEKVFSECLNPIPQPSAFIRREVIDKVGYLDEHIKCSMDWELWLRAGFYYDIKYFPELISTYRLHPDAKSMFAHPNIAKDIIYGYNKLFSDKALPQYLKEKQGQIMAVAFMRSAEHSFAGGDMVTARKSFIKALRLNIKCFKMRHYLKLFLSLLSPLGNELIEKYYIKLQKEMTFSAPVNRNTTKPD